ncbi:MAG: HAD-IA family hydrolase [Alphaproteobacteria bacterium]|nr:HAD-IA family hydrolase [Alphaproteobacteria bacterium]
MSRPILIFDLDGTLVDTAPDLLKALNAVLLEEDCPEVDLAAVRHMVGRGVRALIGQAFARTGSSRYPDHAARLVDRFLLHYRKHLAEESRAFPGVAPVLARLRADGVRLAVLTNKPEDMAGSLLSALHLSQFFDVISGARVRRPDKPDARVVASVMDEMGHPSGRAIIIGDSAVDVATARAAQIPVILVSSGYTDKPPRDLGADEVVDAFSDLPGILNGFL